VSGVFWDPAYQLRPEPVPYYSQELGEWLTLPACQPLRVDAPGTCASCGLGDHMDRFSELCAYCSELDLLRSRVFTRIVAGHAPPREARRDRLLLPLLLFCAFWVMVIALIVMTGTP